MSKLSLTMNIIILWLMISNMSCNAKIVNCLQIVKNVRRQVPDWLFWNFLYVVSCQKYFLSTTYHFFSIARMENLRKSVSLISMGANLMKKLVVLSKLEHQMVHHLLFLGNVVPITLKYYFLFIITNFFFVYFLGSPKEENGLKMVGPGFGVKCTIIVLMVELVVEDGKGS